MNFIYERIGKMLNVIDGRACVSKCAVGGFSYCECGYKTGNEIPEGLVFKELDENFHVTDGREHHFWIKADVKIPEAYRGKKVELVNFGETSRGQSINSPQYIVYMDGQMSPSFDHCHNRIPVNSEKDGFSLLLYLYISPVSKLFVFSLALCEIDAETRGLYYDIRVPYDIMKYSQPDTKDYCDKREILNNALNLLDLRSDGEEWRKSVLAAREYLKKEFYAKQKKEDYYCTCVGHTHIDVAWLWTFSQTREKVQRSFSTFISLAERYPEFKVMSSQPQLYKFLKEEAPQTYEKVKALIRAGRWEAEGAMWVEADCNLPSGEALIRQIIYGKRFFREEFGVDSRVLWLPDVFGYSAALPQIMKKCGVDYFVTSKISWNETDKMPYDVFMWRGIDGTEVLSYFLTAQNKIRGEEPSRMSSYNGTTEPSMIAGTWERFQQKDINNDVLLTYGYGDGGGGTTQEEIELLLRMTGGISGCPTVRTGFSGDFMRRLDGRVSKSKYLPRWVGELYLEFHRGTYTSQAKNKKNNRKSEFLYQNAETAALCAEKLLGEEYPRETLENGWEKLLLCQFHDVLPGSSIKEVYADSDRIYGTIMPEAKRIIDSSREKIAGKIKTAGGTLVFNPNSFDCSSTVKLGDKYVYVKNIPAKGYAVTTPEKNGRLSVNIKTRTLTSEFLRVRFDKNMNIVSLFDKKAGRETIKKGMTANALIAFEDYPREYDAWEITNYYDEKSWNIDSVDEIRELSDGARAGFYVRRRFGDSVIEQKIFVYANEKRLDFDTKIDWKNDHVLLKAAFPFDLNTNYATYDIQYGNVRRPTHRNTSWDDARFEVCMHKFVDVSENGFGVSLLNDCKYGCDALGSEVRLTLLKSATDPDPTADKCVHEFSYSVYPHEGDLYEAGTIRRAYEFNNPMTATPICACDGILPESYSFVSVDGENVFIETVKKAEDSDGTVVRLCEQFGRRSERIISFGFDIKTACICDMLENDGTPLEINGRSVRINIKPFEIVTVKVR